MTDAKQVIRRQLDRAGNTLLLALEPVDEEEFFAENANGFSAAWTFGHLSCVADLFSSWISGELLFGPAFHLVFNETGVTGPGPVSKAAGVNRGLYPKADLLLRFRQASVKALRVLGAFDISQWDDPAPPAVPAGLLTRGAVWERLAVHTDWHCGELAGSMARFFGTYALNILPHHLYVTPANPSPTERLEPVS
jgi:DinB superfamily